MRRWALSLISLLFLAACAQFVMNFDGRYFEEMDVATGATHSNLVFSHNVNGELKPCGCRKFPLGGLEQVAGALSQLTGPTIYVDTGDLFFPSPVLPDNVKKSLALSAKTLAQAMDQLGLKFFVPGDQDFALGIEWLNEISRQHKFTFLVANLRDEKALKVRPWARLKVGGKSLVFIGVVDPDLLTGGHAAAFGPVSAAISSALADAAPRAHELVVLLSHGGMDSDRRLAQEFPRLNWILGAHSQSYTTYPSEEGDTKLVQVLSRNHFLGHVRIPLGAQDQNLEFKLIETREELAQVLSPNPMTGLLARWNDDYAKVQSSEQIGAMAGKTASLDPLPSFNSCVDCHAKQVDFWQGTAHASAWHTLVARKADNDPSCVGCHSAGWQHPQGFASTKERVRLSDETTAEKNLRAYSEALAKLYAPVKSVRALAVADRRKLAKAQLKLIDAHGISHDYGNVQCLNCHDKTREHPFDGSLQGDNSQMSARCLSCHTADQSPEWYQNAKVNSTVLAQKLKAVSCPKK